MIAEKRKNFSFHFVFLLYWTLGSCMSATVLTSVRIVCPALDP